VAAGLEWCGRAAAPPGVVPEAVGAVPAGTTSGTTAVGRARIRNPPPMRVVKLGRRMQTGLPTKSSTGPVVQQHIVRFERFKPFALPPNKSL
jgi:hypothetical protein